jgi:dimethylargininase
MNRIPNPVWKSVFSSVRKSSFNLNPLNMPTALTRPVSPRLVDCELTHLEREPIDFVKAQQQHLLYEQALEKMGYSIRRLPAAPDLPDGVFVEDAAVVFDEVGIITRPGADSRKPETESMAEVLKEYRKLHFIEEPGTLDGGDVLVLGKKVYIGVSERTNRAAIQQFSDILKPFGYHVKGIEVTNCLHLKTAISPLEEDLLLINPDWVDKQIFDGYQTVSVHPDEPFGANVMRRGNWALCPEAFPKTADLLASKGYDVITVDQSEMAKAEAGLTCCSVIVE